MMGTGEDVDRRVEDDPGSAFSIFTFGKKYALEFFFSFGKKRSGHLRKSARSGYRGFY
jgi:hypothetical protein